MIRIKQFLDEGRATFTERACRDFGSQANGHELLGGAL